MLSLSTPLPGKPPSCCVVQGAAVSFPFALHVSTMDRRHGSCCNAVNAAENLLTGVAALFLGKKTKLMYMYTIKAYTMYEEIGVFMKQERYGKTQTSSEAQLTQDPGSEPPKTGWTKNPPSPGRV